MKTQIIVTLQIEGIHKWQNCPLEEVSFLRNEHRHIFHIEARKEVTHNDRDIEIILLKRKMQEYYGTLPFNFGNQSCEMIAEDLMNAFDLCYCKVMEDNENGALITK